MAVEKALADADFLLLPKDWDGELDPDAQSDLMFVAQLDDGEPVKMGRVYEARRTGEVKEGLEEGELLRTAQIELPEGRVLDIRYGRHGALWKEDEVHVLLPAKEPFKSPEEVAEVLARPYYLALVGERLPGQREPIPRRRSVLRECPGPPPHLIALPPGESMCPIHSAPTEPV